VFLESLKLFALAESLGAVESLAEHPYVHLNLFGRFMCRQTHCVCSCACSAIMTHASVPPDQREKLGIR
jgi:cystathionine beta-lyase/cystathionine gamma-synthase